MARTNGLILRVKVTANSQESAECSDQINRQMGKLGQRKPSLVVFGLDDQRAAFVERLYVELNVAVNRFEYYPRSRLPRCLIVILRQRDLIERAQALVLLLHIWVE